ncbi:MAG: MurR/RpiR family transcriptional regulator, partial [Bulleidia sp.]
HTSEMITCAEAMKENKTPILAITRPVKSPISDLADLKLYTTSSESLFRTAAMASRISSMNIIDILYTAFANLNYDHSLRQLRKTHIEKDNSSGSSTV